jgi:hypothetical protein
MRGHHRPPPTTTVTVTTKINGSAPMHRSQTIEFGANVPNRLQRGHFCPFRCRGTPYWGLVDLAWLLRILIVVHSQRVSSAEAVRAPTFTASAPYKPLSANKDGIARHVTRVVRGRTEELNNIV